MIEPLTDNWSCTATPPDVADHPDALDDGLVWRPASVPGTYAAALRAAGAWDGEAPLELDHLDVWYRTSFPGAGAETLRFEGLATIADVWLNGAHILQSDSMFRTAEVDVVTQDSNDLHICFRSLLRWLQGQRGRAMWRTRVAVPATLRFARTTLLGRMPGWCPTVHPVGPWRSILRRRRTGEVSFVDVHGLATIEGDSGRFTLRCRLEGDVPDAFDAIVQVGEYAAPLTRSGPRELAGSVVIPHVTRWWPHTHGTPHLYPVTIRAGEAVCELAPIGFRTLVADHGADGHGFGLRVNDVAVFCRGACWTTPDIVTLHADLARYRPLLEAMRDAGMNMVRVGGTMVYEADAFYRLCDELGLLVWQDAMLANFDYPATPQFRASLTAELQDFLNRTCASASLAVFCGGSEVLQQAVMFGATPERIDDSLYRDIIPAAVGAIRPDLIYVANSPCGGALPFQADTGVAHYYGVGAYLRPLTDARRAGVRFASECLALANVPCMQTVDAMGVASSTEPRWKQAVPRDRGAGWDFDDVRDHYLATLFGIEPLRLRYADFPRYLELSRAVSCVLMEETFNEWRRVGSVTNGALVWQWQDVTPGAGWGVIDSLGRRKAAWYALQRACRTRQVLLTDEGLNGLAIHVLNETDQACRLMLRLACLRESGTPVRTAERAVTLDPRSSLCLGSADLLPGFFDITQAYRFGPRAHDVTIATLHDADTGDLVAEATHFPDLAAFAPVDIGLEATLVRDGDDWSLRLRSQRFAQFLHIDDAACVATENWLHLAPGHERRIALLPPDPGTVPQGEIRALNMDRVVRYAG